MKKPYSILIPALIPALRPNAALMTEAAMLRGVLPKRNRSDKP